MWQKNSTVSATIDVYSFGMTILEVSSTSLRFVMDIERRLVIHAQDALRRR